MFQKAVLARGIGERFPQRIGQTMSSFQIDRSGHEDGRITSGDRVHYSGSKNMISTERDCTRKQDPASASEGRRGRSVRQRRGAASFFPVPHFVQARG